jgi:ClpP class serine protease
LGLDFKHLKSDVLNSFPFSEFQTVTAGKYKRTLTPTKKVTTEDLEKSTKDVNEIFVLFSDFVKQNRPQLDMDDIATGEVWFGTAAMEKGLCDEIKTADEVVSEYVDLGYNVYEVEYSPPPEVPSGLAGLLVAGKEKGLIRRAVRWLIQTVAAEVRAELRDVGSSENRYKAEDDASDRFRARY